MSEWLFDLGNSRLKCAPLRDDGAPGEAQALGHDEGRVVAALDAIGDDPDAPAGDWVHWVLFNLAPDVRELPENVARNAALPGGAVQGMNDYGRNGYDGPCPPPGQTHRYHYKVFALDARLALDARARKADLMKAMHGHVLAQGELVGTYARKAR